MWPPGLRFSSSTFCMQCVFMCFVCTSEEMVTFALYNIKWLVFIIDKDSVYCTVWTGSLYKKLRSVLKGLISTHACTQTHQSESTGLKFHDTEVQHTQITNAEITKSLTNGKVTVRRCPPLSISFWRFAAMTTISLPSTSPAPTSSDAMPSAESFPTANSNLMSFNSRFGFLKQKQIN